jgi:hypothetical protein
METCEKCKAEIPIGEGFRLGLTMVNGSSSSELLITPPLSEICLSCTIKVSEQIKSFGRSLISEMKNGDPHPYGQ